MQVYPSVLLLAVILNGDAVNPGCECVVYSGTYGKEWGSFCSPDFPRPYPASIDCLLYTFVAAPDEIIEIKFKDFDIHKTHLECVRGDFLKVFLHLEGPDVNEYTEWSGLLCGSYPEVPHVLYSSGPALVLELHTDHIPSNSSGFIGTFRFIDRRMFKTEGHKLPGTMCDFQFVSGEDSPSQGRFYSPRYPSSYPKHVTCAYKFRARSQERVRILFEEVTLQKGDISCLNRGDVIRVYDGRSPLAGVMRVVCNEASSVEVLSSGQHLYVEFLSGSEWPGQGFKATYQFHRIQPTTHPPQEGAIGSDYPAVSATTWMCDVWLRSDTGGAGGVSSPGYPGPYPPGSHCRYHFLATGKQRIQITFADFSLYYPSDSAHLDCETVDAVMAYVQIDGRMEKIESFCGDRLPKQIMSNGPRMQLEFRGIYSSRYAQGFNATYKFTENYGIDAGGGVQLVSYPCAFRYKSEDTPRGSFTSPNFPGYYPRDTECHYFFHARDNQRVLIYFNYFDIEGVLPCEAVSASDYVEFSNYLSPDRKYSRQCGQLGPFHLQSDGKFFRVTFRSNDRLDATGFNATYRFVSQLQSLYEAPTATVSSAPDLAISGWVIAMAILTRALSASVTSSGSAFGDR